MTIKRSDSFERLTQNSLFMFCSSYTTISATVSYMIVHFFGITIIFRDYCTTKQSFSIRIDYEK